jgi:glucose 1-dehydrogenase
MGKKGREPLCKEVERVSTNWKASCSSSKRSTVKEIAQDAGPGQQSHSAANAIFADKSQPSRAGDAGAAGSPIAQRTKGAGHWRQLGIGKAIALALGHVCVNYVSGADKAQEIIEHLGEHGFKAFADQADVSKEDQVIAMFDAMREEFGTVDVVTNNAGLQQNAPVDEMTLAQWQKVIDVNLTGQFLCSREAVREFKRRGVRPEISCAAGKIICVSSVHEVIPWAGHVNYAASKGGVMLMMKSIAQEVAPYRIRVNSIAPGAIRTPINMQAWDTPEHYAELLKLIPYKRIGRAAVWLASDDSDYIHGVTLFVDGGMTLYPGFETGG